MNPLVWLAVVVSVATAYDTQTSSQDCGGGQGIYLDRLGPSCGTRPMLRFHYARDPNDFAHYEYRCHDTLDMAVVDETTSEAATGPNGGLTTNLAPLNVDCGNQPLVYFKVVRDPPNNAWTYAYQCGINTPVTGLTTQYTNWDDSGVGEAYYLDRHDVQCSAANSVLTRFQLQTSGSTIRYLYNCGYIYCGDGVVNQPSEQCDQGSSNSNNGYCRSDCKIATCGDGYTRTGVETCDNGASNNNNAACLANCQLASCGDGYIQQGVEECDNGSANSETGACLPNCKLATCGDGFLQIGVEQCDNGTLANTNSSLCLQNCTLNVCGDGFVLAGVEDCDLGTALNNQPGSICTPLCRLTASSRLDPHFVGFNGQFYDVDGIPGKWLNWYSDEDIQVNSLIFTAVPETKATYSSAFAIQLGPFIRIFWAVFPDRLLRFFPFHRAGGRYVLDSCGYAEQQGRDRVVILWNQYTITLVQRQKLVAGHRFRFLNFFMNAGSFTSKVHGLLGQTHRLAHGAMGQGHQGQGIIEGAIDDYVVRDGHWGSDFRFNAFRKAPGSLSPAMCAVLLPSVGGAASSD